MADPALPMNLGYVKTKPGMFKCIAVGVGLLAMAFLAAAFDKGAFYSGELRYSGSNEEEGCQKLSEGFTTPDGRIKVKGTGNPCPIRMLVIPCVFLVALAWVASLVLLIAYLVTDLNQKGFGKIDFILQFGIGGVCFLSVLLVGVFIVLYFLSDYPSSCTTDGKYEFATGILGYEDRGPAGIFRKLQSRRSVRSDEFIEACKEGLTKRFQIVLLIIGELLTIPAGVMYIMAGLMAMKDARGQMMMAPGAQPVQSQGQPMQQTPSQYQQQSVHGSPSARTGHPSQFQQRA